MRHLKLIGVLALIMGLVLIGLAYVGLQDNKVANTCNDATVALDVMEQQILNQNNCDRYQQSSMSNINTDLLNEARNARVQGDCDRSLKLVRSVDTSFMCNVISNPSNSISPPAQLDVSWFVLGVMFILSVVLLMIVTLLHHRA